MPDRIKTLLIEMGETAVVNVDEEFTLDEIVMPVLNRQEYCQVLFLISGQPTITRA